MQIAPGTRLGPYDIVSRLGAGGMGEVWRARDSRLDRDVAVKIISEAIASNPSVLQRFEQEARAAGALSHPNLVTVHDAGAQDGNAFVVMELLEGETLRSKIGDALERETPHLPIRKAIDYTVQIANGLAAAHEKGIVHRDLKPENVFITKDGRVKILDFGLAKLLPRETGGSESRTQQRGTSPGTVMGTVGYMSPEQVRGRDVDHRTDIFSLGAILYEMASGRRAFRRDSAVETMNAILNEDPPELGSGESAVSPGVDRIIHRCMQKQPGERFQSAHDIAFALDAVSTSSGVRALDVPERRRRGLGIIVVAVSVIAAIALAAAAWRLGSRSAPRTEPQARRQFVELTFSSHEMFPTLSPDGKLFAFVSDASGRRDISVQRVGGQNAINLSKGAAAENTQPAFSPDGNQIAFRSERDGGGIFLMGATGESVRRVSDFGFNPSWSPDGREIAVSTDSIELDPRARPRPGELWVVDVASGAKRRLVETDAVQPNWSPHGNRIAYWGLPGAGGQRDLWTVDPHAANPAATITRVTNDAMLDWNPVWSPDGRWLYFSSDRDGTDNLWRIAIDEQSGKAAGEPEPVTLPTGFAAHFAFARNTGEMVFAAVSDSSTTWRVPFDPVRMRPAGAPQKIASGTMLHFRAPAYSPDGKWCAFSSIGRQEDLYVMRTDGTEIRQLTNDVEKDRAPFFSNDGKLLYFYSQRGPRYEIWSIRPDGSGLRQLSHSKGRSVWFPRPLPGGKGLYAFNEEGTSILPLNPDGTLAERQLLPPTPGGGALLRPSISRDGTRLIGLGSARDNPAIWIYNFGTKTYDRVASTPNVNLSGMTIEWLPDGRSALVTDEEKLSVVDTARKEVRPVTMPVAVNIFSVTSDGRELLVEEGSRSSVIWLMR